VSIALKLQPMNEVHEHDLRFSANESGMRLDQALAIFFTQYSRTSLKGWIEAGQVRVNGQRVRPRYAVRPGDRVHLTATLDASQDLIPQPVDFEILHQDDACIVVHKPAGCVVHPGAGNTGQTLVNGLIFRFPELAALPRAGLIHRLDKNTSGLLIVARTSYAFQHLTRQMAQRRIKRVYDALTNGRFIGGGTVDAPIGRDPSNRTRMSVRGGGRNAVTHYRIAAKFRMHTHLEVQLETGRTHQIRVHLAYIGHPITGDSRYGARVVLPPAPHELLENRLRSFARQALHARHIEFAHPTAARTVVLDSPMPRDMIELLDACAMDCSITDT
jgi:23S rRNA pseudouridine1911/1915/1917 synthase